MTTIDPDAEALVGSEKAPELPTAPESDGVDFVWKPGTTGIFAICYPCGCNATSGGGNLPANCPEHPAQQSPHFVDTHGTVFEAGIHATETDGAPKVDSAGKLIRKEHDYNPPGNLNRHFGG